MAWKIYFWLVAALIVLPLPFKLFEYATGRDGSPTSIKAEELINAAFFGVGLVGLYGFAYERPHLVPPLFWAGWVVVAIVLSVGGLFWSPKVKYGSGVMGKSRTRIVLAVGTLFLAPMLVGVWLYSAAA
ncbi:hypothetical protein ACFFGH_32340 [Lysobacter korlensis]|uniref:Transmembrane protein n=1 Tax=Lysobacter korlensis TaxID=553636 RepID=A0ABV6RZY3_9GAMM